MEKEKNNEQRYEGKLIRILSKDIEGNLNIYVGLTKIKGISWAVSNAICRELGLNKKRKIGSLDKEEIEKINRLIKEIKIPGFLLNKRREIESGEDKHLLGNDLELKEEFEIGKLKKIKSYRGFRHANKLPVRGQRTKSHFRTNRKKGAGIKKKTKLGETKK